MRKKRPFFLVFFHFWGGIKKQFPSEHLERMRIFPKIFRGYFCWEGGQQHTLSE